MMRKNNAVNLRKVLLRGIVLGCGILFFASSAAPAVRAKERPAGVDDATWAALSDGTIEFGELESLVRYYNPDYRQILDQITPSVETTRDAASRLGTLSKDFAKQAEEYKESTDLGELIQYTILNAMSEAAKSTSKTFYRTAGDIDHQTKTLRDQTLLSLINGSQQIYIGYNEALASRELSETAVQLAEEAVQSAQTQRDIGLASENDVLTAQQTLLTAQNQLLSLDQTLTSLRQNLYVMTGWKIDAAVEIGTVPAPDLTRIDAMDPASDIDHAINYSYTLRNLDDSLDSAGILYNIRENAEKEAEEKIKAGLETLYQTVLLDRASYDASATALESARLTQETIERQYQLGLISHLQYLQAQTGYLQQKMASDNASMTLFQAILDYIWAYWGIMPAE